MTADVLIWRLTLTLVRDSHSFAVSWVCNGRCLAAWDSWVTSGWRVLGGAEDVLAVTPEACLVFISGQESSIWLTQLGPGAAGLPCRLSLYFLYLDISCFQVRGKRLQSPLIRGFWTSSFSIYELDRHLFVGVALGE